MMNVVGPITLPNETATIRLAACIGRQTGAGDCLLLSGSIGAGKSTFARALIKSRLGQNVDVPSPTFTLVQTYEDPAGGPDIWHCDLYRLSHAEDLVELGLDDAFEDALCLIEWPDRLGSLAPENAIHLHFAATPEGHTVTLHANDRTTVTDCLNNA
jgi:tRNA threonylcarbamoyladenosine biosynthesis protein TsaE